jgi:hypothetical protein
VPKTKRNFIKFFHYETGMPRRRAPWVDHWTQRIPISDVIFLEVKLTSPPESDVLFVGLAKGWKTGEATRYKANVTFPVEKFDDIIAALETANKEAKKIHQSESKESPTSKAN